ncbi:MAG: hypothetical protein EOM26_09040 [Alphaproteobacteria bacterium]|nr:hypothetical protein [Alphaproteobacteria bacterium]
MTAQTTYFFLGRYGENARATLGFFEAQRGYIECLSNAEFELGLVQGAIVPCELQRSYPPVFDTFFDGESAGDFDAYKQAHAAVVKRRHEAIERFLPRAAEVLSSRKPMVELAGFARSCQPAQNPMRFRYWFLLVLAYGTPWALLPEYSTAGHYRRGQTGPKLGRPRKDGKNAGFRMTEQMLELIKNGFEQRDRTLLTLTGIYREILRKQFGCRVRKARSVAGFYHPDGEPWPSYGQFRYVLQKLYPGSKLWIEIRGYADARQRTLASRGKYTEQVSCLLEQVESDGYWVPEIPKSLYSDDGSRALVVVRVRCSLSGMIVGIGFSVGGESAAAYRMALFCCATPKPLFGALFGLKINAEDWPSVGLSPDMVIDRGPAAAGNALGDPMTRSPILTMTPSFSGQSKALIETSNPRNLKIAGKPHFLRTSMNLVQLAKREILRVVRDNSRMDLTQRITPAMAGITPSPLSLWEYFDERMRSHAHQVSFEDAARRYLPMIEYTTQEDGVYLYGQRYSSADLQASGLCDRVVANGRYKVRGYMMPLCAKQGWVDIGGQLLQVDAILPICDDEEQLQVSVVELEKIHEIRIAAQREHLEHRAAEDAAFDENVRNQVGNAGKPRRTSAKPKKTRESIAEQKTLSHKQVVRK